MNNNVSEFLYNSIFISFYRIFLQKDCNYSLQLKKKDQNNAKMKIRVIKNALFTINNLHLYSIL